ncbi:PD-(D/E)XK nuclease family protein [Curtobacterium sp. 22159]|uniref:PD-(D/E)XK nuclease family protein n=1 Tax=Curtobacterium sp. 22159 TaxID=3453882 RepID=UPI003F8736BA
MKGVLAHRAVLWPFVRPLYGKRFEYFHDPERFVGETDIAVDVLEAALRGTQAEPASAPHRHTAQGLLNVDGPNDGADTFVSEWRQLTTREQDAVLDGLRPMVANASRALATRFGSRSITGKPFTHAWSEVPLFAVAGTHGVLTPDAEHLRADLLVYRADGDIEVIDLKFGNATPPDWVVRQDTEQLRRYLDAVRAGTEGTGRHIRGRLLFIGQGRGRPTRHWSPWQDIAV